MSSLQPKMITIHCSDSANGKEVPVAEIRRWHLARGWSDIGYHFVIMPDGRSEFGRPIWEQGAHVEGHNKDNVGICVEGKDRFTLAQFEGLAHLIDDLCQHYGIALDQVFGHYQFDTAVKQGKLCPNMKIEDLRKWLESRDRGAIEKYLLV